MKPQPWPVWRDGIPVRIVIPKLELGRVTVGDIAAVVAYENPGITKREILGRGKTEPLVFIRQIAMYLARELTNLSFPEIGRRFGMRDHTTIMHGHEKIKRLIETDLELAEKVKFLRAKLEGVG